MWPICLAQTAVRPDNPAGDPETWVDDYGDALFRFALARVNKRDVAEDLVQETFLAALKARERFKGRSSTKTWLMGILKHKLVDHLRRQYRRSSEELDTNRTIEELFDHRGHWHIRPAAWTFNPKKVVEQKQFLDVFYQCLSKMSPRLAQAFMLREIEGLDTAELCKAMDISATNSWVMLYRARMTLRRCLELHWLADSPPETAS